MFHSLKNNMSIFEMIFIFIEYISAKNLTAADTINEQTLVPPPQLSHSSMKYKHVHKQL